MKKYFLPIVILFSALTITACSTTQNTEKPIGSQKIRRLHSGSGSMRTWSWFIRSGSGGGMMQAFSGMTTEDQDQVKKMFEARRSGDTETANTILQTLKQKYPKINFERRWSRPNNGSWTINQTSNYIEASI